MVRETQVLWCLLLQKYFCAVHDYMEKADLSIKESWNPKRKLGVTTLFSEVSERQFGQIISCIVLYYIALYNY